MHALLSCMWVKWNRPEELLQFMTFAVVFCLLHHSTFVVSPVFLREPHAVLLGSIVSRVIMLPSYVLYGGTEPGDSWNIGLHSQATFDREVSVVCATYFVCILWFQKIIIPSPWKELDGNPDGRGIKNPENSRGWGWDSQFSFQMSFNSMLIQALI